MSPIDESKPIKASDIVREPDIVYNFINYYIMLVDTSITGSYKNLIEAINLLAERGWETVSLSRDSSGNMNALCRREYRKRKTEDPFR